MKHTLLSALCLFLLACNVDGQLVVNPSNDGNALVDNFLGSNIPVSNVVYIGQGRTIRFFFPVERAVMLDWDLILESF